MALDPVTLSFIAKGAVALGSTIGSAFQKSNVNRLKGDAKRLSNQFIDSAKKRLAKNQMDNLSINTADSRRRLDDIQQSLAQLNLGGADQRTASADAARQMALGTKAAAAENARNRKRVEQLDLLSAQEDSAIAGEIANIELAQGIQERKDLAQLNRMESEANQAMFKGLADIGTAAFGAATSPEAIARRQAKKAFEAFNQAAEGQGVDYMGSIANQMGQYDPNDPAAFLANLDVSNPALKTLMQNTEFAKGLQDLYASGAPTREQLKDFLTTSLNPKQLSSLSSINASASPFNVKPIELEQESIQAGLTPDNVTETILQERLTPAALGGLNRVNPTVSPGLSQILSRADSDMALLQQQNMMMPDPTFGIPNYLFNPNSLDDSLQGLYINPMFYNNIPTVTP